ncbi:hypothetical protein DSCW_62960 [Desulfosarcina widdelii]|uniref:Uncharacterized protein n=1 Tax=Desulfosarcina widdelii TaxID=947919 RepID=A0A5K7ZFF3_9BACT|nr:hypothetical protein DSCW_62960 [Desulfosarcina widdelii]
MRDEEPAAIGIEREEECIQGRAVLVTGGRELRSLVVAKAFRNLKCSLHNVVRFP